MSVNSLSKFNKPGLGGASFGSRHSKAATSGTSKQKAPTNIYSSSRSYSLKAKKNYRNTAGVEIKRGTTPDYSSWRAGNSTNVRGSRFNSNISSMSFPGFATDIQGINQGNNIFGILNTGLSAGMGVAQMFMGGAQSRSAALDSGMSSLGSSKFGINDIKDPGCASAALAMTSATDYQSLNSAITNAESTLAEFKSKGPSLQSAANTATQNLSSAEGKVSDAQIASDTATKEKSTADSGLVSAKSGRDSAKTNLDSITAALDQKEQTYVRAKGELASAEAAYTQADKNLTACSDAASQAKTELDNTPKEIDGPNGTKIPNPAYAQAQAKLTAAEQAKTQAEQAKTQAETRKTQAEQALSTAKQEVGDTKAKELDANDTYNTAINKYATAETKVGQAEQAVRKADINVAEQGKRLELAKDNVQQTKDTIAKYKDYEQSVGGLENTISQQKERLGKLARQEEKEYKSLNKKGTNRTSEETQRMDSIGQTSNENYARDVLGQGKGKDTKTEVYGDTIVRVGTNPTTGQTVVWNDKTHSMMTENDYQQLKANPGGTGK